MLPSLIATDLDGTLLDRNGELSHHNAAMLRAAHRLGIPVVIATGRPPRWLEVLSPIRDINPVVICSNGALQWDLTRSVELCRDALDPAVAVDVATDLRTEHPCLPLNTRSLLSCRSGSTVAMNSDRWLYMTPTYADIDDYRAYLVNHEVGHYIGLGHVSCPAKGAKAKVMMQQSKSLAGCLPNPWPAEEA